MRRKCALGLLLFLSLFSASLFSYNAVNDRTAFLAALYELQHGDQKAFLTITDNIQDYPLYPYLLYSDFVMNLSRATPQELQGFLDTYRDTPLADHLRHLWLEQLAQEQQWPLFLTVYKPTKMLGLQCDQREALWKTNQPDLALQNFGELLNKSLLFLNRVCGFLRRRYIKAISRKVLYGSVFRSHFKIIILI